MKKLFIFKKKDEKKKAGLEKIIRKRGVISRHGQ